MAKKPPQPRDVPVMSGKISFPQGLHLLPIGLMIAIERQYDVRIRIDDGSGWIAFAHPYAVASMGIKPQVQVLFEVEGKNAAMVIDDMNRIATGRWCLIKVVRKRVKK